MRVQSTGRGTGTAETSKPKLPSAKVHDQLVHAPKVAVSALVVNVWFNIVGQGAGLLRLLPHIEPLAFEVWGAGTVSPPPMMFSMLGNGCLPLVLGVVCYKIAAQAENHIG